MNVEAYQNKIRIRVNGILVENSSILLVQIHSPVTEQRVWMPPGGGLEFGESLEDCLEREFKEETGAIITTEEFLFLNELIEEPYHAIELYYRVKKRGGKISLGADPEHDDHSQLLKAVEWKPISSLNTLKLSPEKLIEELDRIDF